MMSQDRLIIFTRYPEAGKSKLRLAPALGAVGAAKLQRLMTRHILSRAARFSRLAPVSVEVCFEGGNEEKMRRCFGASFPFTPQATGDLGIRMLRAIQRAFEKGAQRVVLIGSDCPGITAEILQKAFAALEQTEAVLGPSRDGGYYLVGLRRPVPELFSDTSWGAKTVFRASMNILQTLGLSTAIVDELRDVDNVDDLHLCSQIGDCRMERQERRPGISVIIPALNEAEHIGKALDRSPLSDDIDATVVDGGSSDGTPDIARFHGAAVLAAPQGRAIQMNVGAENSCRDTLLFLHADTLLPAGWESLVPTILSEPRVALGAFSLSFDNPSPTLRLISRLANFRSRVLGMPYGDQALFLKAHRFAEAGGFREMPIMEDFDLVWRLRKTGAVRTAPAPVVTSARRWRSNGLLRTTLVHQLLIAGYICGLSPERLKQLQSGG
jgi:hypothetical protein